MPHRLLGRHKRDHCQMTVKQVIDEQLGFCLRRKLHRGRYSQSQRLRSKGIRAWELVPQVANTWRSKLREETSTSVTSSNKRSSGANTSRVVRPEKLCRYRHQRPIECVRLVNYAWKCKSWNSHIIVCIHKLYDFQHRASSQSFEVGWQMGVEGIRADWAGGPIPSMTRLMMLILLVMTSDIFADAICYNESLKDLQMLASGSRRWRVWALLMPPTKTKEGGSGFHGFLPTVCSSVKREDLHMRILENV